MQYFGSFGLRGDYCLFAPLLRDFGHMVNHYDIIGFSSGASFALQCATQRIIHKQRVGKLILISPLLYTYHIATKGADSKVNLSLQDIIEGSESYADNIILQKFPFITHLSFEAIVNEFSHIGINILWNLFKHTCLYLYKRDRLQYHDMLYRQLGFHAMHNAQPLSSDNQECMVLTYFEKIATLRALWYTHDIDFGMIREKSRAFVAFIAEHDRITDSKLIGSYLSQFGICYILKGRNHILRRWQSTNE